MDIVVFRHGIALDGDRARRMGLSDEERPLTDKGVRHTRAAAAGLRALLADGRVGAIATSSLLRACQTADLLAPYLDYPPILESDCLTPGAGPEAIDTWLHGRPANERVLLVGHEPDLSTWVSWGLTRRRDRLLALKKAGACRLEFPGPAEGGTGSLRWVLPPAQLRALG